MHQRRCTPCAWESPGFAPHAITHAIRCAQSSVMHWPRSSGEAPSRIEYLHARHGTAGEDEFFLTRAPSPRIGGGETRRGQNLGEARTIHDGRIVWNSSSISETDRCLLVGFEATRNHGCV